MDIEQAQEMKKDLQVAVITQIRQYEKLTGLTITKAEMITYQDTRFFTTTVFLPPRHMKDKRI